LTGEQRRTLAAALERILPSDDGSGAAEAGSVRYAERVMAEPRFAEGAARLLGGLELLDSLAAGLWEERFSACTADQRDAVLRQLQMIPHPTAQRFFPLLVKVAVTGFLCAPEQGGNRGGAGWEYIGFDPRPCWPASADSRG
jgi:hypothetical protein